MTPTTDAVAVITDIHGNLPALEAALARIDELEIEQIYCGGDLVGYGPHPNEVCALIAEREIPTIYGNYDYAIGARPRRLRLRVHHARGPRARPALGRLDAGQHLAGVEGLHARAAVRAALPRRQHRRAPRPRLSAQGQRVPLRGQARPPVRAARRGRDRPGARLRPHPQALGARVRRRAVRQLRLGRQAQGRRSPRGVRDPARTPQAASTSRSSACPTTRRPSLARSPPPGCRPSTPTSCSPRPRCP